MRKPLLGILLVFVLAAGGCGQSEQPQGEAEVASYVTGLATAPTATPIPPTPEPTPKPKPKPRDEVKVMRASVGDGVWYRLAQCESGGRWNIENGPYSGGLQFMHSTWVAAGGQRYAPRASQATPEQQIAVAKGWLARTSWSQWPACSRKLGLR